MIENIILLYRTHGGIFTAVKSSYFWLSAALCVAGFPSILNGDWAKITTAVMPSITGFTIAAFALIFAIIGPSSVKTLSAPGKNGKAPILVIASSIAHAVFVQVVSLILASVFTLSDKYQIYRIINNFDIINNAHTALEYFSLITSVFGTFLTFYGLTLVVAVAMSIFRILKIISDSHAPRA